MHAAPNKARVFVYTYGFPESAEGVFVGSSQSSPLDGDCRHALRTLRPIQYTCVFCVSVCCLYMCTY